jgi:FtsP/CotA-like multicopper oxidase with cupredoxin domain
MAATRGGRDAEPMILIAYDGSPDAKAAIEQAAHLMPGQPVAVVTVWEPYVQMLTRYPAPGALLAGDSTGEIDNASREAAEDNAEEGDALARRHGLDASARAVARQDAEAAG